MSRSPESWLTSPLAAGAVLLLFWVALQLSLAGKSMTFDEPIHLTGGYTYWRFNDYRINPENGNLPQRLAALPLAITNDRFPSRDTSEWRGSGGWTVADEWFHHSGADPNSMLRQGRAAAGLIAVALGALVWWWARRLFGPAGGMLALLACVLNPTVLANGALITSDTCAALFFLAATLAFWSTLQRLSWTGVIVGGLALGGLFVSKMSAALIVPVALTLIAIRLAVNPGPAPELRRAGRPLGRSRQALVFTGSLFVQLGIALLVIWACYGFRYSAFAPGSAGPRFEQAWETLVGQRTAFEITTQDLQLTNVQQDALAKLLASRNDAGAALHNTGLQPTAEELRREVLTTEQASRLERALAFHPPTLTGRILDALHRSKVLPEAYVYGQAYAWKYAHNRDGFLNGTTSTEGRAIFFPYTFLVKTPLGFFALIILAAAAAIASAAEALSRGALRAPASPRRNHILDWLRSESVYGSLPCWVLIAGYSVALLATPLNIGHRHMLAVYPPLFVLCGAAVRWVPRRSEQEIAKIAEPDLRGLRGPMFKWGGVLVFAAVAVLALEVAARFPNYIAYFNGIVRPSHAYRHLVNSSLDWGQDLPALKRYIDRQKPTAPVYLSYFGSGDPGAYGIAARYLYSTNVPTWVASRPLQEIAIPISEVEATRTRLARERPDYDVAATANLGDRVSILLLKKPEAFRLTSGTYFVSATMLQTVPWTAEEEANYRNLLRVLEPFLRNDRSGIVTALRQNSRDQWIEWLDLYDQLRFEKLADFLKRREPDDNVNYSILVYRLNDADIAAALGN